VLLQFGYGYTWLANVGDTISYTKLFKMRVVDLRNKTSVPVFYRGDKIRVRVRVRVN